MQNFDADDFLRRLDAGEFRNKVLAELDKLSEVELAELVSALKSELRTESANAG